MTEYQHQHGNHSVKIKASGEMDYSGISVEEARHLPFSFEVVDWKTCLVYIFQNQHVLILTGILYIALIFGIQHLMKSRKAFNLKTELFLWNAALGIFSILGFVRITPTAFEIQTPNGFLPSICAMQGASMPMAFWSLAFTFSKFVELGDTVFIVLRKKPLQLIQWYHHLITLAAVWIASPFLEPVILYCIVMNYGGSTMCSSMLSFQVHSLMYPYFALRALDVKIPKAVANIITSLQLIQMVVGFCLNSYTAYLYYAGGNCYRHPTSIKMFSILYGSFVILFGQLFYTLVVKRSSKAKAH